MPTHKSSVVAHLDSAASDPFVPETASLVLHAADDTEA